ncbi:hypothetical protein [Methanocella sp. MCL-LM]|uniref:hypothetical protein n=1 Tax=Methanocella sp. MCL-LM TaxID=3412035 RepID=UPI003C72B15C
MLRRKSIPAPVFALAGLVAIILLLWGICVLCGYLQNPAGKSQKPPDYYYSYNLSKNGSVTNVLIIAEFDAVLKNYVKYLDSDGQDLEVKIWGGVVSYDAVHFSKEGDDLRVSIRVVSAVDNFLGSSRADEHVYLPRNWTYTIVSTNKNGNTTVENQSWSYSSYGKT